MELKTETQAEYKTDLAKKPVNRLKSALETPSIQEQFQNALGESSNLFIASLIDLFSGDNYLQECKPGLVIMEALKAATLKLPINKNLGFAYIITYKGSPQFQLGYKGIIQLALRTGKYKNINADVVYEGELKSRDKLTGEIDLSGEPTSDKVIGYFAMIELINGFKKTQYWAAEEVEAHAKKFSVAYNKMKNSPWHTNFTAMALKTVLKNLISRYGLMSIEMSFAVSKEDSGVESPLDIGSEMAENANTEFIDIDSDPAGDAGGSDAEVGKNGQSEAEKETKKTSNQEKNKGPAF